MWKRIFNESSNVQWFTIISGVSKKKYHFYYYAINSYILVCTGKRKKSWWRILDKMTHIGVQQYLNILFLKISLHVHITHGIWFHINFMFSNAIFSTKELLSKAFLIYFGGPWSQLCARKCIKLCVIEKSVVIKLYWKLGKSTTEKCTKTCRNFTIMNVLNMHRFSVGFQNLKKKGIPWQMSDSWNVLQVFKFWESSNSNLETAREIVAHEIWPLVFLLWNLVCWSLSSKTPTIDN